MELVPANQNSDGDGQNFNKESKDLKDRLLFALRQGDDETFKHIQKTCQEKRELHISLYKYSDQLLRVAAQHNQLEKILQLLPDVDLNEPGPKGETALHSAAESGSAEAVENLLKRGAKWDARDEKGCTPLHSALKSRMPCLEIVRLLMEKYLAEVQKEDHELIGSDGGWSLSLVDNFGNTPLHYAATYMAADYAACLSCVQELKRFDPNKKNNRGDSALHDATRRGKSALLEAMVKVFYGYEKDVENHSTDKDGNTLLDIAAICGNEDIVVLLLDYGADPRKGVLFKLVSESVRSPAMKETFNRIYRIIIDSVDKWSDGQYKEDIIGLINNQSERFDNASVIEYAIEEGAVGMLEEIIHTETLYEFHANGEYRFRVRFCTPSKEKISLLERIALYENGRIAAEMLYIQPLRHLSTYYLWYSSAVYTISFIFQLIYMICFSCFCIPNSCELSSHFKFNATGCGDGNQPVTSYSAMITKKVGFIFWPVAALIFSLCLKIYQLRGHIFVRRLDVIAHLFSFTFGTLVIIWFGVLVSAEHYPVFTAVTALLFIFGWLQAFQYLSYLGELYIFTNLVKEIIFKDVLKLAIILLFLVIGFSFAIYTLDQTEIGFSRRDLKETVYLTLLSTLNLGNLFDDTLENSKFAVAGGNQELLRVVFMSYMILSFIIFMNILIAMMSDTYQSNNKNAKAVWKLDVLKVSLALMLIKADVADEPILPEKIAGPIIRSLTESEDQADETDTTLLAF